jgi:hypothetical protein
MQKNPFQPLADMLPGEKFDEIGRLFDSASDRGAGDDQWKLNALAVLLTCLEDSENPGEDIGVPLIAKIRALQAAYWLGHGGCK